MERKKGKFIVIEGIDGAGGETQTKLIKNFLEEKGKNVLVLRYPDRKNPIGKVIYQFLETNLELTPTTLFLLYFADFIKDINLIKKSLNSGMFIIADRYFTSTLAYQRVQGIKISTMLKMAQIFKLQKPDITILLKISPETSLKRKYKEKKKLDRFEKDKEFLNKVAKSYEKLARKNVFCKWKIVNAEKSKQDVFEEIRKIIEKWV